MDPDEDPFAAFSHTCGRGHPPVATELTDAQPDDPLVRRYRCPNCERVTKFEVTADGSTIRSTVEEPGRES